MDLLFKAVTLLLRDFHHPEEMAGDIFEVYEYTVKKEGKFQGFLFLFRQIVMLIIKYISNSLSGGVSMFGSYFKTGLRQLKREKLHSAINVFGLTIGLISAMLVLVFIHHELSYDSFHKDSERIVKIFTQSKNENSMDDKISITMPHLRDFVAEVEGVKTATHFYKTDYGKLKYQDKILTELNTIYSDQNFFKLFDFKVLRGNKEEFLKNPESIVLSEKTAFNLFGSTDVIGKVIDLGKRSLKVDGVIENTPGNSHFSYDILLSKKMIEWLFQQRGNEVYTYFSIKEGFDLKSVIKDVESACNSIYEMRAKYGYKSVVGFQMLEEIHLYSSDMKFKIGIHGNITNLYVLMVFPPALLLIVSINFINLLTARSQNRLKETGLRKVIGAERKNLVMQFLSESTVIALAAGIIGIAVFFGVLERFSVIVNKDLSLYYSYWPLISGVFIFAALITGVLSAVYPGLKVSRETASKLLYDSKTKNKNSLMRGTVIVQFVIVVVLITSVRVINSQYSYAKNINPGFNREEVFYFPGENRASFDVIKDELLKHPGIKKVTGSQSVPGEKRSRQLLSGFDRQTIAKKTEVYENRVQNGFIETYEIGLISGRGFDKASKSDSSGIIINEKLLSILDVTAAEAIGRELDYGRSFKTYIIGVMKDYHYFSVREKIEPLILSRYSNHVPIISVRFETNQLKDVLDYTRKTMKTINADFILNHKFLDETFAKMYEAEEKNEQVVFYATIMAIVLSVAGLFALTLFTVIQRTKEIGIRKVMGASSLQINYLLMKEFVKWILAANFLALPIAYFISSEWLDSFAYKIDLSFWYFISAGIISLAIASFTVIYHTTKAASLNPVDSIKQE